MAIGTRALHANVVRAALVALAAAACAEAPEPEQAVEADRDRAAVEGELDRVYARFSEAYAEADVQKLMDEVYAPEAFYLPPRSPILRGQDQFRGQFGFLEPFARDGRPGPVLTFDIVDRDISGDLAYDIGTYTLRPAGQPEAPGSTGKFIVIWKRNEQGQWRMWADAFNPVE